MDKRKKFPFEVGKSYKMERKAGLFLPEAIFIFKVISYGRLDSESPYTLVFETSFSEREEMGLRTMVRNSRELTRMEEILYV